MTIRTLATVAVLMSCVVGACAPAAGTTQAGAPAPRGSVLTQAQLSATNSETLYDAINKLHPDWLTSRGPSSVTDATPTSVDVFMNGTMLGRADYLRDMRVVDVTEVRYWNAGQAAARFGMGHPRGVIEITRK
jgi:hypothetical protein